MMTIHQSPHWSVSFAAAAVAAGAAVVDDDSSWPRAHTQSGAVQLVLVLLVTYWPVVGIDSTAMPLQLQE